jgi:hypothetical protein
MANRVISGDRDLLDLHERQGLRLVTAVQAQRIIAVD